MVTLRDGELREPWKVRIVLVPRDSSSADQW
jgi:hypothetical protein